MSLAYRNISRQRPVPRVKLASKMVLPTVLIGSVLGIVLASRYVHSKVEQTISASFDRTIQLGHWRGLSPRGVWLGRTHIPLADGESLAGQIEAVVVGLDWLALRQRQGLRATVTLVQPDFWLALPSPEDSLLTGGDGLRDAIALPPALAALSTLQIEDGSLTLRPRPAGDGTIRPSIALEQLQAKLHRPADQAPLTLDLTGQIQQGRFQLSGAVDWQGRSLQVKATPSAFPCPHSTRCCPLKYRSRRAVSTVP